MFRATAVFFLLSLLFLGGVYPAVVTGIGSALFAYRAHGSMVERGGEIIGSNLIGQEFTRPEYFWGRPSATTPPYNAMASASSNLGAANPALKNQVEARAGLLKAADSKNDRPVPLDLVTASASGLDPNISIEGAEYQLPRVAAARGVEERELRKLIAAATEYPQFGVLGPKRVNVLKLNLSLDEKMRSQAQEAPRE